MVDASSGRGTGWGCPRTMIGRRVRTTPTAGRTRTPHGTAGATGTPLTPRTTTAGRRPTTSRATATTTTATRRRRGTRGPGPHPSPVSPTEGRPDPLSFVTLSCVTSPSSKYPTEGTFRSAGSWCWSTDKITGTTSHTRVGHSETPHFSSTVSTLVSEWR